MASPINIPQAGNEIDSNSLSAYSRRIDEAKVGTAQETPTSRAATALDTAIGVATSLQLDNLARLVWQGLYSGELSEQEATSLDGAIRRRRDIGRFARATFVTPKRPLRRVSKDRSAAIRHRRELAGGGAFPHQIAGFFPTAQQAALTIIAYEVKAKRDCRLHIQEIADRAKVCRATVQNAIREARRLGLLTVEARRLSPTKNLPNIIRIASREWRTWLKRHGSAVFRWGPNARNSSPQIQEYKQGEALDRGTALSGIRVERGQSQLEDRAASG
jgi:hypothetical protein